MSQTKGVDRTLLVLVLVLTTVGFLIFSSASLGLLAREGARFSSVALSQIVFGIGGGLAAMFLASQMHYRIWRRFAFYIFLASAAFTLLVFVPDLGFSHGGARRWLMIGGLSIQPSEFLKVAYVIYVATLLSGLKKQIASVRYGLGPFLAVSAMTGVILLLQPDTDTFALIMIAGLAMFVTAGGRLKHVLAVVTAGLVILLILAFSREYVMNRLVTFVDPDRDPQGQGWQINQSLIAVGTGGLAGRGFGQSVQKFQYLPEPIGDSIFAVYAEEFGFVGGFLLILLFAFFSFRGYRIASRAVDLFGMLLVVGFITMIITQVFLNIASMLAFAPIMGLPLPFISHGGTALFTTLTAVGIILNVSKHQRRAV